MVKMMLDLDLLDI